MARKKKNHEVSTVDSEAKLGSLGTNWVDLWFYPGSKLFWAATCQSWQAMWRFGSWETDKELTYQMVPQMKSHVIKPYLHPDLIV
jgi:hypothetical protein